jgi:DNA-binding transcriptional LysR family regulator
MDIEINLLRHVVALGECLHFGNAAKSLNLSQPALSRSIGNLEKKLGQPMFERGSKLVRTTDFGRLFINKAKELLAQVDNFSAEVAADGNETFDRMVIGCGPYPAETVVPAAITLFLQNNPKVELVVRIDNIETLLPKLFSNEGLQCIIAEVSAVNLLPGLEITPMGRHAMALVGRSGHPLVGKNPSLQQLLHYPMLTLARMPPRVFGPIHKVWKTVPASKRLALPSIECASMSLAKQIVMRTDAFVAMQLSAIKEELKNGELVVLLTEPWLHLNYGFVQRKGAALSNHSKELKKLLLQAESMQTKEEKRLRKLYLGQ